MIKDIITHNENAEAGMKQMQALKEYFPQCFTTREELQKNLRTLKEGNKSLSINIDVRY